MDPALIRASRRAFLGGTACGALLAGGPALALELSLAGRGHVGFAADMAWWDPRGHSEPARFPQLPVSVALTQEQFDWILA